MLTDTRLLLFLVAPASSRTVGIGFCRWPIPVSENTWPFPGRANGEAVGILSEVSITSLSLLPLQASEIHGNLNSLYALHCLVRCPQSH